MTYLKIITPRIVVTEVFAKELKFIDNLAIKLDAKYKGNIQKIDVAGIDAKIDILKNNQPVKNCKISSGQLTLKHSTLRVQNLYGYLQQNPFSANFSVKNILIFYLLYLKTDLFFCSYSLYFNIFINL